MSAACGGQRNPLRGPLPAASSFWRPSHAPKAEATQQSRSHAPKRDLDASRDRNAQVGRVASVLALSERVLRRADDDDWARSAPQARADHRPGRARRPRVVARSAQHEHVRPLATLEQDPCREAGRDLAADLHARQAVRHYRLPEHVEVTFGPSCLGRDRVAGHAVTLRFPDVDSVYLRSAKACFPASPPQRSGRLSRAVYSDDYATDNRNRHDGTPSYRFAA